MSKGGGGGTTTVEKADPWKGVQPFLNQPGGIYPEASNIYRQNMGQGYIGPSQGQQYLAAQEVARAGGSPLSATAGALGQQLLGGAFDPRLGSVQGIDLAQSRAGQGPLDPTRALRQSMSGRPNMNVLGGMHQAQADRSFQTFQDMLDASGRQFTEQINPAIQRGAQVAGQYGGSRQEMAQQNAARDLGEQQSRMARDLATGVAGYGKDLYGQAYQQAQSQAAQTAGQLGQQAFDAADRNQQLQLQQAMLQPQLALQNRLAGLQTLGQGEQQARGTYGYLDQLLGQGQQQGQQAQQFAPSQLLNYAGIIQPGSGIGGTSTSSSSGGGSNPIAGGIGGMMAGAGLGSMMAPAGATGMAAVGGWPMLIGGGLLGMLAS